MRKGCDGYNQLLPTPGSRAYNIQKFTSQMHVGAVWFILGAYFFPILSPIAKACISPWAYFNTRCTDGIPSWIAKVVIATDVLYGPWDC